MPEPLRIGIAGCGSIVQQVHLPLLSARKDVQLVAVAEPDGAAVDAVLRRFPGVRPYAGLSDMLAAIDLDAVVIALPTALHAAAACQVFSAGLHAYIEKPLATTVEEADAVARAWRGSGRVGVLSFNCRANPLLVRLRDLLRSGRAGALVYVRSVFATAPRALSLWRQQRGTGGGALLDLGVHHIDLVRFLTGIEIAGVRATIASRKSEQDTALLELQLENGVGVHAFFSLAAAETDQVEVHGDGARLSVARFTSLDVRIVDNPGRAGGTTGRLLRAAGALRHVPRALAARRAPLREPGYAILLDQFVRAARAGVLPVDVPDVADGFACAAVVAAAESSLVTGRLEPPAVMMHRSEPVLQAVR
jgi:predicted dehydrogenase